MIPQGDRRHQGGIAAQEYIVPDHRAEFPGPVIIGKSRAATHVDPFADIRIPHIGEMGYLATISQSGVFDLYKIAHLAALAKVRVGAQPHIGPDAGAVLHRRLLGHHGRQGTAVPHDGIQKPATII